MDQNEITTINAKGAKSAKKNTVLFFFAGFAVSALIVVSVLRF
jgi:hypothetical protein